MSSKIGDPFPLATYALPPTPPATSSSVRRTPLLTAAHCVVPANTEGHVVVAAQADGVHVFDLDALHPVSSITLGPSVQLSCAPASRVTAYGSETIRRTYVAVNAAPDIARCDSGKIIWVWSNNLEDPVGGPEREKKAARISHHVSQILLPDSSSRDVLVISPEAALTCLDENLNFRSARTSEKTRRLIRAFQFPCDAGSRLFLNCPVPYSYFIIQFLHQEDQLGIEVLVMSDDFRISVLPVRLDTMVVASDVIDVSCDASGYFSLITSTGDWHSGVFESEGNSTVVALSCEVTRLKDLSFIDAQSSHAEQFSMISLGSSYVLLSGITMSSTPEIAILLWDTQYMCLLDSHKLSFPTAISELDCTLSLVAGSTLQAILVLSPSIADPSLKSFATARSHIFVVPCEVPPTSTLVNAIGRSSSTSHWIGPDTLLLPSNPESLANTDSTDARRDEVVSEIEHALNSLDIERAEKLFFGWLDWETERAKRKRLHGEERQNAGDESVGLMPDTTRKVTLNSREIRISLDYAFVSRILSLVLSRGKPNGMQQSAKILHTVLQQRAVSNDMIEGGLLSVLTTHSDWESIRICLSNVLDIPETEIIQLLADVMSRRDQKTASSIDKGSVPKLRNLLASCLSYPMTPSSLRQAIRRNISQAYYLTRLLEVLNDWLDSWSSQPLNSFLMFEEKKGSAARDYKRWRKAERSSLSSLPKLECILDFLQAIIDSSLPILLQHPPAMAVLGRVQRCLAPQIDISKELGLLCGFLDPFARAQKKTQMGTSKVSGGDWRQRRKAARDEAESCIGLYQLEDLVF